MKKLIQYELRKIFLKRLTQVSLLAILLLSALLGFSSYRNKYAFDGNGREGTGKTAVAIDKELAAKYGGILTDEKVQRMMSDFAPKSDLHGMNAAYLYQNAMQSAVFAHFSDLNGDWNGLGAADVFGREEIRIGYIDGWLTTSQNLVKILIVLACVIVVMLAPIFSGEYGGVDQILLAARYGRTKWGTAKISAGLIAAFAVTLLVIAFNLLLAFALYGSEGLDCSILFAPIPFEEGYLPFNITCGTLLQYQILLAFTGTISTAGMTLPASALGKNQMASLVVSMAMYFFPVMLPLSERNPLFRFMGLLPVYHAQFTSLMSVEQLGSGILYAICAVPAAFILTGIGVFTSCRIFARHQVS